MSLGLTVVTHTDSTNGRDIGRCISTVKDALPPGAEHLIIDTCTSYSEFVKMRRAAMELNDIVVFVDDDDYITKDSLKNCVDALSATNVGLAFTKEAVVCGDVIKVGRAPEYISSISESPIVLHHMTAYRTKYITQRSKNLPDEYWEASPEWILKMDIASTAGAVHIPEVGYYWVQHSTQLHKDKDRKRHYLKCFSKARELLKSWVSTDHKILTWNPPGCL